MNRKRSLPHPDPRADDLACARHVVLNAGKLSLLDPTERGQILALAWRILQGQRPAGTGPMPVPVPAAAAAANIAAPARPNVTSLALWKARQRIKARASARAQACTITPRRPRITVYPADPTNPGDAA